MKSPKTLYYSYNFFISRDFCNTAVFILPALTDLPVLRLDKTTAAGLKSPGSTLKKSKLAFLNTS